jgi:hypothetical protein
MSTKKSIDIVINAKGEVTYEAKGIKGASCLDETAFLQAALGGESAVVEQEKTAEFYENAEGYASAWSGEGKDE